jgi:uncharacterized protein YidB (DUF937 family)
MGLLDDLLGQLAGGGAPRPEMRPQRTEAGASGSMAPILMTLLPVVLAMLRNRGGSEPSAGLGRGGASGGLGDVLGQVLGGAGAGGGLGALLDAFTRAGAGEQARSWVSAGDNQPIGADVITQVFGKGGLAEIARRAGLSEDDASRGLAQLMPEVVDRVTPQGRVPEDGSELLASVDAIARRLGV